LFLLETDGSHWIGKSFHDGCLGGNPYVIPELLAFTSKTACKSFAFILQVLGLRLCVSVWHWEHA
jgi:hypothetical protein